jgi:hypothetical protein
MSRVPPSLANRLSEADLVALERFLGHVRETLGSVYSRNVSDYVETRGDDAQLFGLKVWKHEWYALGQAVLEDAEIQLVEANGSYAVLIGPLRVGVYGIGDYAHEDVLQRFPDTSPTKRAFGHANQMQLFEDAELTVAGPEAYMANSLTIGHFGNPREGLVKWYLGAWAVDDQGRKSWLWIERQDDPGEGIEPLTPRPPVVPFNEGARETFDVRPRPPA